MLSFNLLKGKPKVFKSLTGHSLDEFYQILDSFDKAYDDFILEKRAFLERKRAVGGGRKAVLSTTEDRLLFILFYFKIYPIQEVMGFFFSMGQAQANEWIHRLSPVLQKALGYELLLPERKAHNLKQVLSHCPSLEFVIDASERPIQRPKDSERQKECYSGKKKRHTVKNNLITNFNTKRVEYLSGTYEGKKHDKKICDEEEYEFPVGTTLLKDTGYQGYEPENVFTLQPKKKPRNKELSENDKMMNKIISSLRITVEHVIGSVKVCRIVKDIFRNTKEDFNDLTMEIACGLHNLKVSHRNP